MIEKIIYEIILDYILAFVTGLNAVYWLDNVNAGVVIGVIVWSLLRISQK